MDEPLPAGTQVAWYTVTWHDVNREPEWMGDRMYRWYEGSVRTSEPTIVTVEATQTIPAPEVDPITEDSESITGSVSDPDLPVIIEIDGERNETEADGDGNFEFPLEEPLPEGTEVVVVQEDEDGNRGDEAVEEVGAGETDPDQIGAPQVDPITEDSESITGTVEEPELPVIVEIDGEPNEVETDEDGNFEFPLEEPLPEGTEVVVVQEDEGGNRGEEAVVEVEAGEETPAPIAPPTVDPITEDSESITGTVEEPELPVIVEIDGEPNVVEPDEDVNFEFPLEEPLPEGTELVVVQEDEDGNRGEETVVEVEPGEDTSGELVVDPTMSIPVLQQMTDEDTVIEGVATDDELSVILYVDGMAKKSLV